MTNPRPKSHSTEGDRCPEGSLAGWRFHIHKTAEKLAHCVILMAGIVASGCTVGPDFSQPEVPGLQLDYLATQQLSSAQSADISQWWQAFGDPKMNALLDRAQSQNLPLREAYERIVEARANFCLEGGQLRPNGDLFGDYAYTKNSQNARPFVAANGDPFDLFNLGVDASWELDLFGQIARRIEAADAEVKFQENEYEFIRQTLFADIVSSYLRIRLLQSQEDVIRKNLATQARTSDLVEERMQAGVSTQLDKSQTDSFRFRTDALLTSIRQQTELEYNQLSALLGQTPDLVLRQYLGIKPLPELPPIPTAGLPADLLRRRPDVRRQEMAVKTASALIGVAEADLYPQFSLLGTISVGSKNISGLFETNGLDFSVGPSFRWNILNFGRIQNNIEINESRFRQSIARYQETVLAAVREVEDAMVNHEGFLQQWRTLDLAVESDLKAVELSLERYRAGKANFQRVLDSQQQLLGDQTQSFEAQSQSITQLVRLYRAVGGGWELNGNGSQFYQSQGPAFQTVPQDGVMIEPNGSSVISIDGDGSNFLSPVVDTEFQPFSTMSFGNPQPGSSFGSGLPQQTRGQTMQLNF
jgi:NodT family efflux transporter outer membrane factor (OMF) lipoprotein